MVRLTPGEEIRHHRHSLKMTLEEFVKKFDKTAPRKLRLKTANNLSRCETGTVRVYADVYRKALTIS